MAQRGSWLPASDVSFNDMGAVAALDRHHGRRRRNLLQRTVSPLTVGGLRQSMITLVQTSIGGGVLALAFAVRLAGLGLGLVLLAFLGFVAFLGMDIMMRAAVKLQAFDTATLLVKCVGKFSGPVMDVLLMMYGYGALIAYFILLGDFLPAILDDMVSMGWLGPSAVAMEPQVLRTRCILGTLLLIVPLSVPRKLSALRYATPVALVAVTFTALVVLLKCPSIHAAHVGEPGVGEIRWFTLDWGFFKSFSIFLFAYNCHLNVVPVASELTSPSDVRISKVTFRVVLVEFVLYALIGAGGYLSFLAGTQQNILTNYGTAWPVTISRVLLSCTIMVGIPTSLNPTVRSLQGLVEACLPKGFRSRRRSLLDCEDSSQAALLSPTSPAKAGPRSEVLRFLLTAVSLCVQVTVAINVPNVADVMGLIGASVGTMLMMVMPGIVLLKADLPDFSPTRTVLTTAAFVVSTAVAFMAIGVMLTQ